ncbi:ser-thr-rich glycosyl-phosphatidyl-inositol-anchored membrane family domain-containing protein [Purpureocillium lavendulum]|uniref:Ser-thr-rich glycosyl-phosphatidyl-inositol-anchored membrane family domain-containing protein n=1 Tax=Purpureocillium lavendulum TaxID=1247861 RepID=A0AB34G4Z5_9HYPO|nr:ser-thr-rich glycosyl-phosphatidyl-inositol-anchored membrane family domain-containing protein [Purpureocillium lavendulum]
MAWSLTLDLRSIPKPHLTCNNNVICCLFTIINMRFTLAAFAAMAATAFAQTANFAPISAPNKASEVTAGKPFTIQWQASGGAAAQYANAKVTISLLGGSSPETLVEKTVIAEHIPNSALKFEWQVASTLGDDKTYGIQITAENQATKVFQYSEPFQIKKGEGKTTGSGTVTLTTSHGTKTITLSTSTTPVPTTTSHAQHNTTTSSIRKTTSIPSNTTTTLITKSSSSAPVVITSTAIVNPSKTSASTTAPTTVPTGAASLVGAGSLSVVAGLFVALVAM